MCLNIKKMETQKETKKEKRNKIIFPLGIELRLNESKDDYNIINKEIKKDE